MRASVLHDRCPPYVCSHAGSMHGMKRLRVTGSFKISPPSLKVEAVMSNGRYLERNERPTGRPLERKGSVGSRTCCHTPDVTPPAESHAQLTAASTAPALACTACTKGTAICGQPSAPSSALPPLRCRSRPPATGSTCIPFSPHHMNRCKPKHHHRASAGMGGDWIPPDWTFVGLLSLYAVTEIVTIE